jgi:hypothetical protein
MWQIADGGDIEEPDGGFLDQRTHTPDPEQLSRDAQR